LSGAYPQFHYECQRRPDLNIPQNIAVLWLYQVFRQGFFGAMKLLMKSMFHAWKLDVKILTNAKLVIKPLMDRSSQGWNQFRITEPPSVADSGRKVVASKSRDHGLGKIGYQRCVLWRNE
jgi:hypothetical protein